MESKFIPKMDALKSTDWRKPEIDKKDKKKIVLLVLCLAMFAVVFIPWFCLGVSAEELGSVKLRAFGFHTWYGIAGGILALIAAAGVLYRHYALTLCSSVLAMLIGFYAMNDYPTSRVSIELSDRMEDASASARKMKNLEYPERYNYDDYEAYEAACERYYRAIEKYQRDAKMAKVAAAVEKIQELPSFKVPGQIVEFIAMGFDLVDQRFVGELLEKEGVDKEIKDKVGDFKIHNHRLGAILYLVFAFLTALMAYFAIVGCNCRKAKVAPVEVKKQESSETVVLGE
jgi:hypothetical protein